MRTNALASDSIKQTVDELQSQESRSDGILKEVVALWSAHEVCLQVLSTGLICGLNPF